MSKFIIQSERIGKIGDTFEPIEGVNIDALIAGGFISTDKKTKTPKIEEAPKE